MPLVPDLVRINDVICNKIWYCSQYQNPTQPIQSILVCFSSYLIASCAQVHIPEYCVWRSQEKWTFQTLLQSYSLFLWMSSFLDLHSLYPMNKGFHFLKFTILVVLKRPYIYSFYVTEYQHFPFGQDAPNIFSIFTCSCKSERVLSDKFPKTSREGNNPHVTYWGFKKKSKCKVYTRIWLST